MPLELPPIGAERLRGKVAVVTGAASGIGEATARALAAQGVTVAVCDIDAPAARRTAEAIGTGATAHHVDVASEDDMRHLVDQVLRVHGAVDIVVNNAGVGTLTERSSAESLARFRTVVDVNFWGVVYGSLFFLPHLRERPQANLVNVASWASLVAVGGAAAYSASKFAVRGFTQTLQMELQGSPVRVTLVCPGFTRTKLFAHAPAVNPEDGRRAQQAFERTPIAGDPSRVAARIVRGIRQDRDRVLTGLDSRAADLVARALPGSHPRLLAQPVRKVVRQLIGDSAAEERQPGG